MARQQRSQLQAPHRWHVKEDRNRSLSCWREGSLPGTPPHRHAWLTLMAELSSVMTRREEEDSQPQVPWRWAWSWFSWCYKEWWMPRKTKELLGRKLQGIHPGLISCVSYNHDLTSQDPSSFCVTHDSPDTLLYGFLWGSLMTRIHSVAHPATWTFQWLATVDTQQTHVPLK